MKTLVSILGVWLAVSGWPYGQDPPPLQDPPHLLKRLSGARDGERREDVRRRRGTLNLKQTIERVGRAFERSDARGLEKSLVPAKIYLALKGRSENPDYYGASQVKFIFEKLFRDRQTRSFEPEDPDFADDGSAYFRAAWSYVVVAGDELTIEHLRFKAEENDGEWRISEIRTVSR